MPAPAGEVPAEGEEEERMPRAEEEDDGMSRIALRIGEGAAAAVALGAVGGLLVLWRRRSQT